MSRIAETPGRILRALAFVAALGAVGACGSDDPVGLNEGIVIGQVRLEGTTTGVPGVTLTLSGPDPRQGTTGSDGVARFESVLLGAYNLSIQVPNGYELSQTTPASRGVTVAGGQVTVTFLLRDESGGE